MDLLIQTHVDSVMSALRKMQTDLLEVEPIDVKLPSTDIIGRVKDGTIRLCAHIESLFYDHIERIQAKVTRSSLVPLLFNLNPKIRLDCPSFYVNSEDPTGLIGALQTCLLDEVYKSARLSNEWNKLRLRILFLFRVQLLNAFFTSEWAVGNNFMYAKTLELKLLRVDPPLYPLRAFRGCVRFPPEKLLSGDTTAISCHWVQEGEDFHLETQRCSSVLLFPSQFTQSIRINAISDRITLMNRYLAMLETLIQDHNVPIVVLSYLYSQVKLVYR